MRDFCKLAVCAFLLKQDAVFISYGAFHSVRTCLQRPGAPMGLMTLCYCCWHLFARLVGFCERVQYLIRSSCCASLYGIPSTLISYNCRYGRNVFQGAFSNRAVQDFSHTNASLPIAVCAFDRFLGSFVLLLGAVRDTANDNNDRFAVGDPPPEIDSWSLVADMPASSRHIFMSGYEPASILD